MNLKLQEKDASALFLALDEIVYFDLYKENLLLDPSKQYAVRPTAQQTQQVKKKPFRR